MRWNAFVRGACRELPVETAIVAAAAVGAIGLNRDDGQVWYWRLLLAALVATPLVFAAHRLARFGRRVPAIVGGLAAGAVFGAITATLSRHNTIERAGFHWPYLLALIAATLVPFVVPGPPFARFMRRFFEQTTTWGVLCAAALVAWRVVVLALEELFDLRFHRFDVDAMIVIGCGFVLVYLHRLRADEPANRSRMPELWRRLATMIGAPFASAMLVILAAYEIAAKLRGELPRNMLSPLILAAGLVGFVTTLIVSSVLDEPGGTGVLAPIDPHRWTRRWSVRLTRAFPVVLLALLPMAWWALWLRIDQHGVTPFRAVRATGLACLTGLSVLGTLRWLRGRAALSWEVPAAIAAFAIAAAFGPLSAVRLSIHSQAARAARILDAAGIPRTLQGAHAQRVVLSEETYADLEQTLHLLAELGGESAVREVLRGATEVCALPWQTSECLAQLGVVPRSDPPRVEEPASPPAPQLASPLRMNDQPASPPSDLPVTVREAQGRFTSAAGEVELVALGRSPDEPRAPWVTPSFAGFRLGAKDLAFYNDGIEIARASLADLIAPPPGQRGQSTPRSYDPLPTHTHPLIGADGSVAADVAVERLQLWQPDGHAAQIVGLTAVVVWRR
jgi:Domain of unknown function (DUF4153)